MNARKAKADAKFTVKFVKRWDADQIVALYKAGGWWKDRYDPSHIPKLIRGSFAFAVAVDSTGRAVGMGRAISDGASDAYIQDVVVLPSWRGRGLGGAIIDALVHKCTDSGLVWVGLIAEGGSEDFYRQLGFDVMSGCSPMLHRGRGVEKRR